LSCSRGVTQARARSGAVLQGSLIASDYGRYDAPSREPAMTLVWIVESCCKATQSSHGASTNISLMLSARSLRYYWRDSCFGSRRTPGWLLTAKTLMWRRC